VCDERFDVYSAVVASRVASISLLLEAVQFFLFTYENHQFRYLVHLASCFVYTSYCAACVACVRVITPVQVAFGKSKVCIRLFTMGQGAGSRVGTRRFQAMGQNGFNLYSPHLFFGEPHAGVPRRGSRRLGLLQRAAQLLAARVIRSRVIRQVLLRGDHQLLHCGLDHRLEVPQLLISCRRAGLRGVRGEGSHSRVSVWLHGIPAVIN
jgi:hypothetical protein